MKIRNIYTQFHQLEIETADMDTYINLSTLNKQIQRYLQDEHDPDMVCYVLKKIREAMAHREHQTPNVRHTAQKLLRGAVHPIESIIPNAKRFAKALEKARDADQFLNYKPKCICLDENFKLEKIQTLGRLMNAGKVLHNCCARREDAIQHLESVNNGNTELWLLRRDGEPHALIEIDRNDNREISQFEGKDKQFVEISTRLGVEILKATNANAHNEIAFTRVGAYRKFINDRPHVNPIVFDGEEHWIWLYTDELIIGSDVRSDGQLLFSSFPLPFTSQPWSWHGNHMDLELLFDKIRQHPELSQRLRSPILNSKEN